MAIQLNLQVIVPDENREKLMLLLHQVAQELKGYFDINPDASPTFNSDHTVPDTGRILMNYDIV